MKTLFICKRNETYGFQAYTRRSAGLYNSTRFIVESLEARGLESKIVEVRDNNDIDREVAAYRPDAVILEALWVVPEKFDILKKLHPSVKWFCHLHSNMPFLALEGIAVEWIRDYAKQEVHLIANSLESYDALRTILTRDEITYLPNVYIGKPMDRTFFHKHVASFGPCVNIACLGAVRPMKNHLTQALAAIEFGKQIGRHVRFFINATRVEVGGDPVLKNLRALKSDDFTLIELPWYEPEEMLKQLNEVAHIGMQVSLTETFNVVSADYVTAGVPVVTSPSVKWVSCINKAEPESIDDIVKVMHTVYKESILVKWNQRLLRNNSKHAQHLWYETFKD